MNKINPSGKISFIGSCKGIVCGGRILYEWSVYREKIKRNHSANEPKKKTNPNAKIEWELDDIVTQQVEQYRRELVFVIKKFTLTPGRIYRFTLTAGPPGGNPGLAQRNGVTNIPPQDGNCGTYDIIGEAMTTEFEFWCTGWQDEDKPLRYEFIFFGEDNITESLFYFGVDSKARATLPAGNEKHNFTLDIEMRVIDIYLATARVRFSIQVI